MVDEEMPERYAVVMPMDDLERLDWFGNVIWLFGRSDNRGNPVPDGRYIVGLVDRGPSQPDTAVCQMRRVKDGTVPSVSFGDVRYGAQSDRPEPSIPGRLFIQTDEPEPLALLDIGTEWKKCFVPLGMTVWELLGVSDPTTHLD